MVAFVAAGVWTLHWRLGTLNPGALILCGLIYGAELLADRGTLDRWLAVARH